MEKQPFLWQLPKTISDAFDGDKGPNTGDGGLIPRAGYDIKGHSNGYVARIVGPTLAEMKKLGCPFKGVLYAGLWFSQGLAHQI